jgi:hypothetical protein
LAPEKKITPFLKKKKKKKKNRWGSPGSEKGVIIHNMYNIPAFYQYDHRYAPKIFDTLQL